MIAALQSWLYAVFGGAFARRKPEEAPRIGEYRVDYSEPTQKEIDEANASCADLFKTGDWVPVNRKP